MFLRQDEDSDSDNVYDAFVSMKRVPVAEARALADEFIKYIPGKRDDDSVLAVGGMKDVGETRLEFRLRLDAFLEGEGFRQDYEGMTEDGRCRYETYFGGQEDGKMILAAYVSDSVSDKYGIDFLRLDEVRPYGSPGSEDLADVSLVFDGFSDDERAEIRGTLEGKFDL